MPVSHFRPLFTSVRGIALPSQDVLQQVPSLAARHLEVDDTKVHIDHKKHQPEHDEGLNVDSKSALTVYTIAQTVKAFWKAVLFSGPIAVGAMYDAYVVSGERYLNNTPNLVLIE